MPISSDAVQCVPSTLCALCLQHEGLAKVKESGAIAALASLLLNPAFTKVLHYQDTLPMLGSGLDELVRQHPSLRSTTIAVFVRILVRVVTPLRFKFDRRGIKTPPKDIEMIKFSESLW